MTLLAYSRLHRFKGVAALSALVAVSALAGCSDVGPAPQPIDECPSCSTGEFKRGALFLAVPDVTTPMVFTNDSLLLSGDQDTITQVAAGNRSARATLGYINEKIGIAECGANDLSVDLKWDVPLECTGVIRNPDGSRFVVAKGNIDTFNDRRTYYIVYGIDANGRQRWHRIVISEAGTGSEFSIRADQRGGVMFFGRWVSSNPVHNEFFSGHFDADGNETRIPELPLAVFYETAVVAAKDGTMVMLGRFSNTISFRGVAPLQASGADGLFIAALKPDGNAAWAHKIEGTGGSLSFRGLSVFDDGRIMFAGRYEGTALTIGETQITGGNAYIAQLNAQGQLTRSLSAAKLPTFAGFVPTATGIFAAGSANVTVADGPMLFGGSQITKTDGSEAVLVHFTDSRVTSIKQLGGYGEHYASSVARAATGEIFATIIVEKVGDRENDPPTLVINGTELTGTGTFVGEVAP